MPVLGDPTVLDNLASRYDRCADGARSSGRRLANVARRTNWECDAADRFRAGADHRRPEPTTSPSR